MSPPEWLLACAGDELREKYPQQYLALFLCLWAGLRLREADLLAWQQIDFERRLLHVRRTTYFQPKTDESQRLVDLAPEAVDVLRGFKAGCTTEFVLDGAEPRMTIIAVIALGATSTHGRRGFRTTRLTVPTFSISFRKDNVQGIGCGHVFGALVAELQEIDSREEAFTAAY